jgi:uncharacterized membrane protein YgaE (UPF0421/DUF939 family)
VKCHSKERGQHDKYTQQAGTGSRHGRCGVFRANRVSSRGVVVGGSCFPIAGSVFGAITTVVITQSSLGAALSVSQQRFIGTALGAAAGALVATYFGSSVLTFALCVFILGPLCVLARSDRSAYRFAGVTVAIVLLVPRTGPAWKTASHRFAEVFIGIAVALMLSAVWPEQESDPLGKS